MVLNRAQGFKEKSHEVSARKNNNRLRYNKKCRGGRIPPPGSFRVKSHLISPTKYNYTFKKINQPYGRVHQPYATHTLASALREMFGMQMYKHNARALLLRILSIRIRSVRGVYDLYLTVTPCLDTLES